MKIINLLFLILCFCSAELYAQEIAAQGWAVTEPGQHSSGTVARAVTGSAHDPSRSSSGALIPAVILSQSGEEGRPPFPVLMPKAIVYPQKAIRKGWEGKTVVAAEILPDGSVGRTALARSSGHEILDRAAQGAIQTWKFGPLKKGATDVPQYVDIPVTFKLEDHGER